MPRWLSRLIAVVTLLAFLTGNSYAISHARSLFPRCPCGESGGPGGDVGLPGGCEHCHADELAAPSAGLVEVGNSAAPSPGDDLPCPCCPCPGGCAFCSVAKVPCLSTVTVPAVITPCVDDDLDEAPPVYDAPFASQLTRPPRS
jgi:hypothetical protein